MNNNVKTSKLRDPYWQYVRGVCIICVVLIHCKNGIEYGGNDISAWNFNYWLILRQLINFPVAIFIFLSGYFTNIERFSKLNMPYISNRGGAATSTIFSLVYLLYNYQYYTL